jgi:hypothetical protein
LNPESLQARSGVAGHVRPLRTGRRTSVASFCQSPATPLATMRNCNGPNAEGPNALAGSTVATATFESSSVIPPSLKLRVVEKDSSAVATSIFSLLENDAGDCARIENVNFASCGNSSWPTSRMLLFTPDAEGCTNFPISVTLGRGSATEALTSMTLPSLRVTLPFVSAPCLRAAAAVASWAIIGS